MSTQHHQYVSSANDAPELSRTASPTPSISPSISPSVASSACFSTSDRSVSDSISSASSSTISLVPPTPRSFSAGYVPAAQPRRGYVRPQGVEFADSARARDSVMSLGSITHLQYYFARTGLLDGKGAQMARDTKVRRPLYPGLGTNGARKSPTVSRKDVKVVSASPQLGGDENGFDSRPISPYGSAERDDWNEDEDENMLPPTVSTYNFKAPVDTRPPDMETLKAELMKSLDVVSKTMNEIRSGAIQRSGPPTTPRSKQLSQELNLPPSTPEAASPSRGMHEIQGLYVLDVVTLAIKAAKDYHTMHEQPSRIYSLRSEKQIREELLGVMDVLKRLASRSFAGGLRNNETETIDNWVKSVQTLLQDEQDLKEREINEKQSWTWMHDSAWPTSASGDAHDRARELSFMRTFLAQDEFLPAEWSEPSSGPSPLLASLSSGLILVNLHNRLLKHTHRQFGEIKLFHKDTAKPYRAADNLRYWIKAAEIRWEVKLKVDVMGVVYNKSPEAWKEFDEALLRWCETARKEVTEECLEAGTTI